MQCHLFIVGDTIISRNKSSFISILSGKASASIKVSVVGKPGMPEDRLTVSNVHRGGCRLNWQPSKDDGGLPLEYVVEKYVVAADAWSRYTNKMINEKNVHHI